MRLTLAFVVLAALPAFADPPKAKSVTKEGEWDVVTMESGVLAKVSVPKSLKKGEQPGLVMTLHGHGGEPNQMLQYGASLSEHRADVWCAYQASDTAGPGHAYNTEKDSKGIVEVTKYVIATYNIDPKRVILHGFSAGGAMSFLVAPANKDLYAGFVTCAAPDTPGGRGGDVKGMRVVGFLGDGDPNFSLAPEYKKAVEKFAPNVSFYAVNGLAHDLPDIIYLNDAFNFILDATEKGKEQTVPLKPDHALATPKGRQGPPPDFFHIYVAWKTQKSPAGVTRNKLQAKSLADSWLSKLKKGDKKLADYLDQSDDAASKDKGGGIDYEAMGKFSPKLVDKAKAMKAETWEEVETESGYHLVWKAKN